MIRYRAEDSSGGEEPEAESVAPEAPAAAPVAAPAGWGGPSQEEWEQTQRAIQYMAQAFQPEEEEPQADVDIEKYIAQRIEQSVAPFRPIVEASARREGEETLNRLLNEHKTTLGDFDVKLAERAAQSFLTEIGGDPKTAPLRAVEAGAKYAVEMRKNEREEGVKQYQERLKRGPHDFDPAVSGGGDRTIEKAKTYDEVIESYASQTEV